MVQGDTASALSGALAGFYHQLPVADVEAGLRSGDRWQPFPEEVNRRLITTLSTLHLAPTRANVANLLAEGVPRSAIVRTGNTVIDALYHVAALPLDHPAPVLEEVVSSGRRLVLVTVHRRESWGEPLASVARALARVARGAPDVLFVLPAHPNPTVRKTLLPVLEGIDNVRVVEPLDYRDFAGLLARAELVITDSGGIQEEAPSLGIPVLVLREITERAEGIAAGVVELVGTDEERIVARAEAKLAAPTTGTPGNAPSDAQRRSISPYGDGRAARADRGGDRPGARGGWVTPGVGFEARDCNFNSTRDTIDFDPRHGDARRNPNRLPRQKSNVVGSASGRVRRSSNGSGSRTT